MIGLDKTTIRDNTGFHPNITQLAAGFEGPLTIVDARDGLLKNPPDAKLSILVPVNGTEPSRRAAEVAIAMARATRAPRDRALRGAAAATASAVAAGVDAILKDIVALGESLRRRRAHRGALREARRRGHPQGDGQAASTI